MFCGVSFLQILKFFLSFLECVQKKSVFWQKEFWRAVIIAFRVSRRTFWGTFFWKERYIFTVFWLWAKNFWTFGKKNSAELSKLPSTCPHERFKKLIFWKKWIKFLWFQHFEHKRFWLLAQNFGSFLKTAVYVSWPMFCGVNFLQILNFFVIFGVCAKTSRAFGKKNSGELS